MQLHVQLHVQLGGLLGEAIEASRRGRLSRFITSEASPAIRLFAPAQREAHVEGDWYGEHAGKWLVAAARAATRSGDDALAQRVRHVALFLAGCQTDEGYLGTYAASQRFTVPQPPKPDTWDGAPARRSWDLWIHAYLVLGLLEVHRHFPDLRLLRAACRIGDLCAQVLQTQSITTMGNHHGLSATVMLDAAMQLHADTGDARYLALAETILAQADADPALALLRKVSQGVDPSEIGTGKAYQLQWNLVGLVKLARATQRDELRVAVERLWLAIRDHHLTLGGGPWGGVAHRSREVFNPAGTFSPQAYVETCSTLSWIQLNRELLAITGDVRHAEEIERSAYNDLLGALAPNGEDWCYYVFPNGRRVHTTYWRCCKSSGAMALEELPLAAADAALDNGLPVLSLHLLGPLTLRADFGAGRVFRLSCETAYPFDGQLRLQLQADAPSPLPGPLGRLKLRLRIPAWAGAATWQLNDEAPRPVAAGAYAILERPWSPADRLQLRLPMAPVLHRQWQRNVQESRAPDGAAVRQEVLRHGYAAFSRGPLAYATALIDGFKTEETVRLPDAPIGHWVATLDDAPVAAADPPPAAHGPTLRVTPASRGPIDFVPYYRAGGRTQGAWRLTWLSLAPDHALPLTDEPALD